MKPINLVKISARLFLGRKYYEILRLYMANGRWPDLNRPKTFNEKISVKKLSKSLPNASTLADKLEVREFVASRVGREYLNDIYLFGDDPDQVRLEDLPASFVVKATHGSGDDFMRVVKDKSSLKASDLRRDLKSMLGKDFGWTSNEPWYDSMPRRFIIEKLLVDGGFVAPIDYKFFVFHGKVRAVNIDLDRSASHARRFYTKDWEPIEFDDRRHKLAPVMSRPKLYDEMVDVAEKLAKGMDFVRVDLYSPSNEKIVFGEITFAPRAGYGQWPECFNDWW